MPRPGHTTRIPRDHIDDLARQAGNPQRRSVEQFDARDIGNRDPPERGFRSVRLAGNALSVDENIPCRLAKATRSIIIIVDREAWNPLDHLKRRSRSKLGETVGRIDCRCLARVRLHLLGGNCMGRHHSEKHGYAERDMVLHRSVSLGFLGD